jgi:hypothetical protein
MMEAVRTSETSVNLNVTTRHYTPENSKLHEPVSSTSHPYNYFHKVNVDVMSRYDEGRNDEMSVK